MRHMFYLCFRLSELTNPFCLSHNCLFYPGGEKAFCGNSTGKGTEWDMCSICVFDDPKSQTHSVSMPTILTWPSIWWKLQQICLRSYQIMTLHYIQIIYTAVFMFLSFVHKVINAAWPGYSYNGLWPSFLLLCVLFSSMAKFLELEHPDA
jgi:hypothetical protein